MAGMAQLIICASWGLLEVAAFTAEWLLLRGNDHSRPHYVAQFRAISIREDREFLVPRCPLLPWLEMLITVQNL